MKNSYRSFAVFFLLFSFSILFFSCSQESGITAPNESQATTMAKTAVVPTGSINHTADTIITFPKSGKTLVVSKSYSAKQLLQIDDYLATHTIKTITSFVTPMALPCDLHYTYDVILENEYEPAYQKNIGIWCDYLTPAQCSNYGFNKYFISDVSNIQAAITAGFTANNIMFGLSGNYLTDYNLLNGTPPNVGSYYLNEVEERGYYTGTQIATLGNLIASKLPGTNFCFSSYSPLEVSYYTLIIQGVPNVYIMCDEYHGNCDGSVSQYWAAFQQNYYPGHNNSNFMEVVANDENCDAHVNCIVKQCSDDWGVLLQQAYNLGENTVWLYAAGTGNETAVQNFCSTAWQFGWMYRYQLTLATEWLCSGTCSTCSWPDGNWSIAQANIVWAGQWVPY